MLDTGAWPEHPSFADQGNLGAPPAKADGTARACDFGDNPLTPGDDPFVCNNKLIGGEPFLDTYLSEPGRAAAEPYHDARATATATARTPHRPSAGNVARLGRRCSASSAARSTASRPARGSSVYKVCGIDGCFASDSAAAVEQAILDGVDVINFSISGGTDPFTDPVELAFLDAYAAGVFVAASAGNDGPGAGTANHLSPWVTTVAASTQPREFASTLTLTGAARRHVADVTAPRSPPASTRRCPSCWPRRPPYNDAAVHAPPAPPGIFTGKIVACQRGGNARVEKGFNVLQGGAAGMILYNPTPRRRRDRQPLAADRAPRRRHRFVAFLQRPHRRHRRRSRPARRPTARAT